MSLETPESSYPNLSQLDVMWRGSGRNFYAIICEALGSDEEAYQVLTAEIIEEWQRKRRLTPESAKSLAVSSILGSLDGIVTDCELINDEGRMSKAHGGMRVWLALLKGMARTLS
jgi:hypothetical protein